MRMLVVLVALLSLAGCCAPCGPAYSEPCAVGGAKPCGTATFLHRDGTADFYKVYPRGVYLQQPFTRPN